MARAKLIARLEALSAQPNRLAAAIHACWRRRRLADGWNYGPADHWRRTSPYLKPLDHFCPAEMEREVRLALNDLQGIVETLRDFEGDQQFIAALARGDCSAALERLRGDSRFVEQASVRIHEGWRTANRSLGTNVLDVRLNLRFVDLVPTDRELTMSNVQSDIEAITSLLAS